MQLGRRLADVDDDLVALPHPLQVPSINGEVDPYGGNIGDREGRILLRRVFAERNLAVDDRAGQRRPDLIRRETLVALDLGQEVVLFDAMTDARLDTTPGNRGVT